MANSWSSEAKAVVGRWKEVATFIYRSFINIDGDQGKLGYRAGTICSCVTPGNAPHPAHELLLRNQTAPSSTPEQG